MKALNLATLVLVIVGGLILTNIVYVLVGLSAIWQITGLARGGGR